MPRVLNARHKSSNWVWVDRTTIWGNPFRIGPDGDRLEVIARYEQHLLNSPELLAQLDGLRGKDLRCHCAPLPCHADVLLKKAN